MELCLIIDHACNLRCRYCYTGDKFGHVLSLDVAEKALDRALARNPETLELSFFGGEPLLHPQLLKDILVLARDRLARLEKQPNLLVVLNTNGTQVTDQVLELVVRDNPCVAFVSLDGPASIHDLYRKDAHGHGSHTQVIKGMARLREAGANVIPLAVINPDTAVELGAITEAILAEAADRAILSPNLYADWTEEALQGLQRGVADAAHIWARELARGHLVRLEPFSTKILSHLFGGMPCPVRCTLGGHEWAIAPSGRIYPCPQLVHEDRDLQYVIGHVDTGLDLEKIDVLARDKARIEITCRDCALRDRCQSDCGCRQVALTHKLGEVTGTLCDIEATFIEEADTIAASMYQQKNPGFIELYYQRTWHMAAGSQLVKLRRSH